MAGELIHVIKQVLHGANDAQRAVERDGRTAKTKSTKNCKYIPHIRFNSEVKLSYNCTKSLFHLCDGMVYLTYVAF